jgi:HK97 family phage major capsid protein
MTLQELRNRLLETQQSQSQILDAADQAGREMTSEELQQIEELDIKADALESQIQARERIEARQARLADPVQPATVPGAPAPTQAAAPAARSPRITVGSAGESARFGFETLGHFARAVYNKSIGGSTDPRLQAIQNAQNEGVGADGAFAVPPQWQSGIWEKTISENDLASRCDDMPISSNQLVIPKDNLEPWSSSGIQAYWESEAGTITASQTVLAQSTARANKLTAMVRVTEELLEDAPAMEAHINRRVPRVLNWKLSDAIIRGNGVGKPQGLLNAGGLITIAKEGAQSADTVLWENARKMYVRMIPESLGNAIWVINPGVQEQLMTMEFTGDSSPVFIPAGGLSGAPYSTLYGRPIIVSQACSALGDLGDMFFVDLSEYMLVRRGGLRSDISMHLYFSTDEMAFRFVVRVGGMARYDSVISAAYGTHTLSPYVTLAAR